MSQQQNSKIKQRYVKTHILNAQAGYQADKLTFSVDKSCQLKETSFQRLLNKSDSINQSRSLDQISIGYRIPLVELSDNQKNSESRSFTKPFEAQHSISMSLSNQQENKVSLTSKSSNQKNSRIKHEKTFQREKLSAEKQNKSTFSQKQLSLNENYLKALNFTQNPLIKHQQSSLQKSINQSNISLLSNRQSLIKSIIINDDKKISPQSENVLKVLQAQKIFKQIIQQAFDQTAQSSVKDEQLSFLNEQYIDQGGFNYKFSEASRIGYQYKQAQQKALKSLKQYEKKQQTQTFEYLEVLDDICKVYFDTSQYKKSIQYFETAKTILDKHLIQNHYFIAGFYNRISKSYAWTNQFDKAIYYIKQGQKNYEVLSGKEKIQKKAENLKCSEIIKMFQENYDGALKDMKKSLYLYKKFSGSQKSQQYSSILNNIVEVLLFSKRYQQCIRYQQKSVNIARKMFNYKDFNLAKSLSHLGLVYAKTGNQQKAEKCLNEAQEIYSHLNEVENQVQHAVLRFSFYILQQLKGNYHSALEQCQKSYQILLKRKFDKQNIHMKEVTQKMNGLKNKIAEQQSTLSNSMIQMEGGSSIYNSRLD